jgi:hypothetical protein
MGSHDDRCWYRRFTSDGVRARRWEAMPRPLSCAWGRPGVDGERLVYMSVISPCLLTRLTVCGKNQMPTMANAEMTESAKAASGHATVPVSAATKLRKLIETTDDIIVAPGVYDGLSARIALSVGFDCLYMVRIQPLVRLGGVGRRGLTTSRPAPGRVPRGSGSRISGWRPWTTCAATPR